MDSQEYASPVFSPFGGMGGRGKAIPSFQVSAFPAFFVANPSRSGAYVRRIHAGLEACPFGLGPQGTQRAQRRKRERPGSSEAARTLQRHCEEKLHGVEPERRRKNRVPKDPSDDPEEHEEPSQAPHLRSGRSRMPPRPGFRQTASGSGPLILEGRLLEHRRGVRIDVAPPGAVVAVFRHSTNTLSWSD